MHLTTFLVILPESEKPEAFDLRMTLGRHLICSLILHYVSQSKNQDVIGPKKAISHSLAITGEYTARVRPSSAIFEYLRHGKNLSSASGTLGLLQSISLKNIDPCPRPVTKHRLFSYSVQYAYTTRIQKDSPMPQGIPVFCSPATDEIHSLLASLIYSSPPPHQGEIKRLENRRRQDLVRSM
jgi:hypothetical protein